MRDTIAKDAQSPNIEGVVEDKGGCMFGSPSRGSEQRQNVHAKHPGIVGDACRHHEASEFQERSQR